MTDNEILLLFILAWIAGAIAGWSIFMLTHQSNKKNKTKEGIEIYSLFLFKNFFNTILLTI